MTTATLNQLAMAKCYLEMKVDIDKMELKIEY